MKKSLIAMLLLSLTLTNLVGCATKKDDTKSNEKESVKQEQIETPSELVTMENITISPIEIYSTSVDYGTDKGYVIEGTISNANNGSYDVMPEFSAVISETDNYGKEVSREVILLLSSPSISSPYSFKNNSIALAPNEIKTVRYYIGASGGSNTRLDVASIEDKNDFENIYYTSLTSISEIKLNSISAKEADVTYISTDDWAKDVKLKEVTLLLSTGNVMVGTVTNNTNNQWNDVQIQFEIRVDGQTMNTAAIGKSYRKYAFVDIGQVLQICENDTGEYTASQSIATYESKGYKVELIPTVLAYTPDTK